MKVFVVLDKSFGSPFIVGIYYSYENAVKFCKDGTKTRIKQALNQHNLYIDLNWETFYKIEDHEVRGENND